MLRITFNERPLVVTWNGSCHHKVPDSQFTCPKIILALQFYPSFKYFLNFPGT